MENKFAAFLSDLTNTNRTVACALDSTLVIRPIASRYPLEFQLRFINLFRGINFKESLGYIRVDNMHMLRKLVRRVRRFNKAFIAHQLNNKLDVERKTLVVRIQDSYMEFTINIATNTNPGSSEIYHLVSERLCFNASDGYSDLEAIDTVFEL